MTEPDKNELIRWIDVLFKLGTPVIIVLSSFIIYWLQAHYVPIETFGQNSERLSKLETAFMLMTKENEVNNRQEKSLADHETRIRVLEEKSPRGGHYPNTSGVE